PEEIAVVGAPGPDRDELALAARRRSGAVVIVADGPREDVPLLIGRAPVDGRPAAYVCRGFVCERPVTDPAAL
ncbi:MAG: N-acylglucosamine 2-epimerase, partial [Nocardioides sp.]